VSDIAQKTLTLRAKPRLPKRFRYKGTRKDRLWRLRATAIALSLALGTATSGCSLSYKLDSFAGRESEKPLLAALPVSGSAPSSRAAGPPEDDLAYAKEAAAQVVARNDKDASQSWSNPGTGARGTVTPIARAYPQDGSECRDFLVSYLGGAGEAWLQGNACRAGRDTWTVRSLRTLTQS
jgi:surface antigen